MKQAEEEMNLADEQYGSRKNLRSITAALNKKLILDIWRTDHHSGAFSINDAASCYDRIHHIFASLSMQSMGLSSTAARILLGTLQKAVHHISTGFGRSGPIYGNEIPPKQGGGQGSGLAPPMWASISSILIKVMKKRGHGCYLESANLQMNLVGIAFVDDTDLILSHPNAQNLFDVHQRLQLALDDWEQCIHISGGALNPSKSFWFNVGYEWVSDKWVMVQDNSNPLTVKDTSGHRGELEFCGGDSRHRNLGYLAPTGRTRRHTSHQVEGESCQVCSKPCVTKIKQESSLVHLTTLHPTVPDILLGSDQYQT